MKEELKGISAAQDTLQEVVQKNLSTVENRMDPVEEKVMWVEVKVLKIEENLDKTIQVKFEMVIREEVSKNTMKY